MRRRLLNLLTLLSLLLSLLLPCLAGFLLLQWLRLILSDFGGRPLVSGILDGPAPAWRKVVLVLALFIGPPLAACGGVLISRTLWQLGRRARQGLCLSCGYDLRATPEHGRALLPRCPECGVATPPDTPILRDDGRATSPPGNIAP